ELTEEVDGIKVLVAAVLVGDPLAGLAGIVEVEHGGDGIDAQAVQVIFLEPEERAAEEEGADLVPAVVEDGAFPVGMTARVGVGMRVEVRAVEVGEAVAVGGKV